MSSGYGLAQALDQRHWLAFQTPREPSASSGVHQLHQLLAAQVQELVEINAPVSELPESSLLLALLLLIFNILDVRHL